MAPDLSFVGSRERVAQQAPVHSERRRVGTLDSAAVAGGAAVGDLEPVMIDTAVGQSAGGGPDSPQIGLAGQQFEVEFPPIDQRRRIARLEFADDQFGSDRRAGGAPQDECRLLSLE